MICHTFKHYRACHGAASAAAFLAASMRPIGVSAAISLSNAYKQQTTERSSSVVWVVRLRLRVCHARSCLANLFLCVSYFVGDGAGLLRRRICFPPMERSRCLSRQKMQARPTSVRKDSPLHKFVQIHLPVAVAVCLHFAQRILQVLRIESQAKLFAECTHLRNRQVNPSRTET